MELENCLTFLFLLVFMGKIKLRREKKEREFQRVDTPVSSNSLASKNRISGLPCLDQLSRPHQLMQPLKLGTGIPGYGARIHKVEVLATYPSSRVSSWIGGVVREI